MIYHVVKRIPGAMQIYECPFDPVSIENIRILPKRGNENNTYFSDGKHEYHFNGAKNTLYMIFSEMTLLDEFPVMIETDPYRLLASLLSEKKTKRPDVGIVLPSHNTEGVYISSQEKKEKLCLPLYSISKGKRFVPEKSGLNQWNAAGRKRHFNEIYIPYQAIDRKRNPAFFPPRDKAFMLHLPDGTTISAKVCQEADKKNPLIGKAVMSNPNKDLGEWLLREVFEIQEGTIVTYEMLEKFGIDSVVFTKNKEGDYSVDFSSIGTYEEFYSVEAND